MKRIIGTTTYSILAAAILSISACTKNHYYDCPGGGGEQNRITLSSEVQFGIAESRLQDDQIVSGRALSLFVTRTGSLADADQLYINNRITADGAGGFTYRVPMYYPSGGTAVDFYAIHPYAASTTFASPLLFSIQADQTAEANYLNSDLLFGSRANVSPQVNAIPLVFRHKMSKLDFVITTRSPAIDLNRLTEISVLGIRPQTTIDLRSGDIAAAAGTPATVRAFGSAVITGTSGNQTATGYTAIIVPQTAPGAQQLFGVMIDGQMRYHVPLNELTFDPGTKYTVTLDVSDDGITLTSQIEDWTDGGTIGGPAGPQ